MSVPNKSLDKNKRYAGVKANDFVNKTRANENNRSGPRPQGWANLGKINSRRIPPPANVPSLKSETGVNTPTFDPTVTTNYGWTSNENSQSNNPTQQQLDSLPVNSPTPPSSADIDKPRVLPPTWSTITAGPIANSNEQTPNLLALNDFPRLATTQDRKIQPEPIIQNPTFRPANLATWKEGGGTRVQSLLNDLPQMIPTNPGASLYPQQNMRMYPPQMWTYNPYPPVPLSMHQQQRVNSMNEYKSPTILRNKDIDDLSKITDNTWANASQEVNYEEKIRFSDDEDFHESNPKSHRMPNQILKHTRLIQDDEHLKQMQDNKNSELINALTIAKQRRDEQERHLRNEQLMSNIDEQKSLPGYQTRPLLTSNDQENYHSSSLWQTNKESSNLSRTPNSQSSFAMKSWSDQMDSFNYSSLHETSGGGHMENEDPSVANQYSRSQSESSLQSQSLSRKSKRPPLILKKPVKSNFNQTKTSSKNPSKSDNTDYYDNSNDQWENWNEPTENRPRQQLLSDDHLTQKSSRHNKQSSIKIRPNDRQQVNLRTKPNKINQSTNNKSQPAWRPLSPTRTLESIDPTSQESFSYKSQQRTNVNDHKQRYQTSNTSMINTASIPPLMSVRSDATTTAKLFNTTASDYYDDENAYYDSNLQTHQRYHQSNLHNRGYTALGSYGRYRRSGTIRHQQQYPTYNINNTSEISSAPSTSTGTRQKKNSNTKKTSQSSEQTKTSNTNSPIVKNSPAIEEVSIPKPIETSVLPPTPEIEKSNGISDQKSAIKHDTETNPLSPIETELTKPTKKTPTTSANSKRRANKNQQNYQHYQNQQPPRHRNNYPRAMQDYEPMQIVATHNYYGTNRRTGHGSRNSHMHDLSSGYYYENSQTHYNNRYNYSNDHYQQQSRSNNKNSKRGGGGGTLTITNRQPKQAIINGSNNNNNNNFRHHSISDNDQKEGEEWETASESSTNMRNGHYDNTSTTNETKTIHRGRTPPKKSFSSQRPHARQIFKYTNA